MRKSLLSVAAAMLVVVTSNATTDDLDAWMQTEGQVAVARLNANISAAGTHRGVVLASPSQVDPNYYYFWVRDGAMVMRAIFDRYEAGDGLAATQLRDYVAFSRENQNEATHASADLGEPRFNVDGHVNTEPWGRPQNDGPAVRALTLIRYARSLLKSGDRASVERDLYTAELPARSVIKADLEFIAYHWQDRCIDLWEEVMGHHFFTEATQMVALREGADLAREMNDSGAATFYASVADEIETQLASHWDSSKGYYLASLDFSAGPDHQKPSQLDVSVLLAALFVEQPSGLLSLMDDHIIKTADAVETTFEKLYPINASRGDMGTAIGRYSEDIYYGGNPWVLATIAYAEWNYRMATIVKTSPNLILSKTQARYLSKVIASVSKKGTARSVRAGEKISSQRGLRQDAAEALRLRADSYLQRVRLSAGTTGHLAEQFDLRSGKMMSARDLSWSYAAFLRAAQARDEFLALP